MKLLLSIALITLLVVSCKKEPEKIPYCTEFPNECVDVREVKDYFYFKIGSWWVYEEENSGMRDSLYVVEAINDTSSVLFTMTKRSSYDGYDYRYWTTGVWGFTVDDNNKARKTDKSTRVVSSKFKSGDFVAEDACFLFYPRVGLWTYTRGSSDDDVINNKLIIEEIYDSLEVKDVFFHNVVMLNEQETAIEGYQPTNHYYSPHYGLVKKELLDSNQVWNLVDYHIQD